MAGSHAALPGDSPGKAATRRAVSFTHLMWNLKGGLRFKIQDRQAKETVSLYDNI